MLGNNGRDLTECVCYQKTQLEIPASEQRCLRGLSSSGYCWRIGRPRFIPRWGAADLAKEGHLGIGRVALVRRPGNSPTVSAGEQKTHIAARTACPDSVPAPPVTPALRSESRGTWPFRRTPEFPDTGTPAGGRWLFSVAKLGRKTRNFAAGFATTCSHAYRLCARFH